MPTPEHERAKSEAEQALDHAARIAEQGRRIAAGWRKSREDNNYRAMLRRLASVGGGEAER